jgi:hypothetical protein
MALSLLHTTLRETKDMCSGCGRCGETKRTLSSQANGLVPDISLIQVADLESGLQTWTVNGSGQPFEVTVSGRMTQGRSSDNVDKTVCKDPMVGFRKGMSHPNH